MVSEKSKANLRRGNPSNKGNKKGRAGTGKTWQDLILEYGETTSDIDPTKTWKQVVVASAYRQAALGNAGILRELLNRSEPIDTNINITGRMAIFDYAAIDRLVTRRPADDSSES